MSEEFESEYWVSFVGKLTHAPDVSDVLERHNVSLDRLQWIHGMARAGLRHAGVYVYFWKAGSGKKAEVRVHGVEFALRGMRGGKPYRGSLPHGIVPLDSFDQIQIKLAPRTLIKSHVPGYFGAEFPDYRLSVQFDTKNALKTCGWISSMELRRIPARAYCVAID